MKIFNNIRDFIRNNIAISKRNPFLYANKEISLLDIKNRDFYSIPYGTIIWAHRYKNIVEKNNIDEGHQEGPFLVVGRNKNGLLCFYGTGVEPKDKYFKIKSILLDPMKYRSSLGKDTFVDTSKIHVVTEEMFIKEIDALDFLDRRCLDKRINIGIRYVLYDKTYLEHNDLVSFDAGDVINKKGKIYLILEKNGCNYTCLPLLSKENIERVSINGYTYYYDFANVFEMSDHNDTYLVDFMSSDEVEKILAKRNAYLKYQSNKNVINRGSLLRKDDELYYVYGENGDMWLAFKVFYERNEENEEMAHFTIEGRHYHSDFRKMIEIPKKDDTFKIEHLAKDKEIDDIKLKKKNYMKSHTKKSEKVKRLGIDSGDIVEDKSFDKKKYIVVIGNQDDIVVVNSDCIETGDFTMSVVFPGEVKKVGRASNNVLRIILDNVQNNIIGLINKERFNKLVKKYEEHKDS